MAELCAAGYTNAEIAELLGIAESTVKQYVRTLMSKLGVRRKREIGRALGALEELNG